MNGISKFRQATVLVVFLGIAAALGWRAVELQLLSGEILREKGNAQHLREVEVPAHRAMITDRNGEPLAISAPVNSIWCDPRQLMAERARWPELARLLDTTVEHLDALIVPNADRRFVYLQRRVTPDLARQVSEAGIAGVYLEDEYKRYYPFGEITAHVVGITNIDDEGQEGLELAYNDHLRGKPGLKRIVRDGLRRSFEDVEELRPARQGTPLTLSIDRRLQYIAYRELKLAVQVQHRARSGSVVILDPNTGEILAMVNQPSFNPNAITAGAYNRNRAVTDVAEPGSTVKPFAIAAALESGRFRPEDLVPTAPGSFRVGAYVVKDQRNYGTLDLGGIIEKSSNVGAARVAVALESESLWRMFSQLGFGAPPLTGFPGEATGRLLDYRSWTDVEKTALSRGYGLSASVVQLARAYAALASDGILRPVTFLRQDGPVAGERVMSVATARELRDMMLRVVEGDGGTGTRARVPGYMVAGKTGTAYKVVDGEYAEDRYLSSFAAFLPASAPRLVAIVTIDEPQGAEHFGGQVAAPVFANIMTEAARILNIPGDPLPAASAAGARAVSALDALAGEDSTSCCLEDATSCCFEDATSCCLEAAR